MTSWNLYLAKRSVLFGIKDESSEMGDHHTWVVVFLDFECEGKLLRHKNPFKYEPCSMLVSAYQYPVLCLDQRLWFLL